jgi:hypothetical protein
MTNHTFTPGPTPNTVRAADECPLKKALGKPVAIVPSSA